MKSLCIDFSKKRRVFASLFTVFYILLSASCNPLKEADRKAEKNKVTTIYPTVAFDSLKAIHALQPGNSTIRGILFTKEKTSLGIKPPLGQKVYAQNTLVTLFPVTDYFNAWYELRKKRENKRTIVYMSNEAFHYRLETKTDEYGRFAFENLKPGTYFLQSIFNTSFAHTGQYYTGRSVYGNYGTAAHEYEYKTFYNQQNERIEKFVEIDQDGEIQEIKLK
ncbi:carboxypeptidase regulatory-like domain-containing protein [Sinomicrobium pectinilyticum]|uniref:Carboxypeptidase regulatory-like domain-containing protein n=1 Tax=Sinomicrobium pectinilyticum TaxID=1084421 RepID=A0A3N0E4Y6_SINP1|nr:carboxypeptidase-like regulatory domain-containing protein [Sinomicrobium pectinilyticum]RNL82906.1 carboxypeptidase regulatory-like domain-containing protein [Sinomicrobium pectinilyticum]